MLSLLPQDVKRPGAVLFATPGEQNALHRDWSVLWKSIPLTPETDFFARFQDIRSKSSCMISIPSAMRGPGREK
jgi:hypothetical protein